MAPTVVIGSATEFQFVVADFANTSAPFVSGLINPVFSSGGGGCTVDINGNHAVIGDLNGSSVRVVDVSNPRAPVLQGLVNSNFGGIGAVSIRGSFVAIGEAQNQLKGRVSMIDMSNPNGPGIIATASTPLASPPRNQASGSSISSITWLSDHLVAAAGADVEIALVDFSNPAAPAVTTFNPALAGAPNIAADSSSSILVAADSSSGMVKIFDSNTRNLRGRVNTQLRGIDSVSVSGSLIIAGSVADPIIAVVDTTSLAVTTFNPTIGQGFITAMSGGIGVCGAIADGRFALFDVLSRTVTATARTIVSGISSIAVSTSGTVPVGPHDGPHITLSETALHFGLCAVSSPFVVVPPAYQFIHIHNSGNRDLYIHDILFSNPVFFIHHGTIQVSGQIFVAVPGQTGILPISFAPTAETSYTGIATLLTNDPAHPKFELPLSGTGALPHITTVPAPGQHMLFITTSISLFETKPITISNSGALPLTVAASNSSTQFSVSPQSLTVAPNTTAILTVTFKPTVVGIITGGVVLATNDPKHSDFAIVFDAMGSPADPPGLRASPPQLLDFGDLVVENSKRRIVTLSNTSSSQTFTADITTQPPFYIFKEGTEPAGAVEFWGGAQLNGVIMQPNSSIGIVVTFATWGVGPVSGNLDIRSSDLVHSWIRVALSGVGVSA